MLSIDFIQKSLRVSPFVKGKRPELGLLKISTDSRNINESNFFLALRGEKFDGHDFAGECYKKGVRCFVVEKRYKRKILTSVNDSVIFFVDDTMQALSSLAISYKNEIFANSVAITGSSGKTTTRELIVSMLAKKFNVHTAKRNFNNEIGLPLTILDAPLNTHLLVLELGMNHRGEISRLSKIVKPFAAIITNIGYAHIGNLGSRDEIARAKAEIFDGMDKYGYSFLNRDDDYYDFLKKVSTGEVIDFSHRDLNILEDKGLEGYLIDYKGKCLNFSLPGRHNLANLACAIKVAEFFNIDENDIADVILNFKPVSGRSEVVRKSITVINDSYNANPASMKMAFEILSKVKSRKIAVVSDMLELGKFAIKFHEEIGEYISSGKLCDAVFAYGELSKYLINKVNNNSIVSRWFNTKQELIDFLLGFVEKGDTILVKASHSMGLEEVAKKLIESF
jgi:UDP-N-acetylmuramoyl-tripeptide--D-alanyl-D-alanine ligase